MMLEAKNTAPMTIKKPTPAEFDCARAAVPAQHPVAEALLAALDDAKNGNEMGVINDEYAHEVIRWVRRSGMSMSQQLLSHQEAMQALDAHQRAKLANEQQQRTERMLVRYVIIPLVAVAIFLMAGVASAVIWAAR